jgi:hypothetical protein
VIASSCMQLMILRSKRQLSVPMQPYPLQVPHLKGGESGLFASIGALRNGPWYDARRDPHPKLPKPMGLRLSCGLMGHGPGETCYSACVKFRCSDRARKLGGLPLPSELVLQVKLEKIQGCKLECVEQIVIGGLLGVSG